MCLLYRVFDCEEEEEIVESQGCAYWCNWTSSEQLFVWVSLKTKIYNTAVYGAML